MRRRLLSTPKAKYTQNFFNIAQSFPLFLKMKLLEWCVNDFYDYCYNYTNILNEIVKFFVSYLAMVQGWVDLPPSLFKRLRGYYIFLLSVAWWLFTIRYFSPDNIISSSNNWKLFYTVTNDWKLSRNEFYCNIVICR